MNVTTHRLAVCGLLIAAALGAQVAPAYATPTDPAPAGRRLVKPGTNIAAAVTHIYNVNSQNCLAARAGWGERPAIQTTCDFKAGKYWPDQYWQIRPVTPVAAQLYSPLLDLCLVARGSGETAVVATTCGSAPDQQWVWWIDTADSTNQFQNANSGLCLAARGAGESPAIATTCDFNAPHQPHWADQHWTLL